jgi:hypothetical protein
VQPVQAAVSLAASFCAPLLPGVLPWEPPPWLPRVEHGYFLVDKLVENGQPKFRDILGALLMVALGIGFFYFFLPTLAGVYFSWLWPHSYIFPRSRRAPPYERRRPLMCLQIGLWKSFQLTGLYTYM